MHPTIEHFTRREILRLASITPNQLGYWERLQLIQPNKVSHKKVYTFRDLVSLRAVKQLREQHIPAGLLRQALEALGRHLRQAEIPLTELRIRCHGGKIVVEYQGATIEPLSGQLLIHFATGDQDRKVSAMPQPRPDEGLTSAPENERSIEAHINAGTLLYEEGKLVEAAEEFRFAVERSPQDSLAHFNLGTVLEDLGQLDAATHHLREALRLRPKYADAHYNLARVYEKLNACLEARHHWRRYLQLDPDSQWASYARQRLGREDHMS
jgi:tetratricopeptide (TPR) repeat protein